MSTQYVPDIQALAGCALRAARSMSIREPESREVWAYVRQLVHSGHSEGGKDVLANVATWLARTANVPEPSARVWGSRDLELAFEVALLGRPAQD